jgi:hypothetical protein
MPLASRRLGIAADMPGHPVDRAVVHLLVCHGSTSLLLVLRDGILVAADLKGDRD